MARDTTRIQGLTRVSTLAELDIIPTGPASGDRAKGITVEDLRDVIALTPGSGDLDNVVIVNSLSDFPDPVAGVIELVPIGTPEIVYLIGALTIDVSPNVFSITSGEVVISGIHRTASGLTTSATSPMFTCLNSAFFQEFMTFTCPNGKWVEYTNPTGGFLSFANNNVIILDCDSLGTIDGAFVTSLRTFTVLNTQSGGFTWTGTTNGQINTSNFLAISWTGTLFDLNTATFDLIRMGGGDRYISPAGTTILSGATGSANLTATGRGLFSGAIFNGLGTALSGITPQDIKWEFEDNIFADNVTKNSRNIADAFLTALQVATNGGIGVYVAIGGTNWSSDFSDRFTVTSAGVLTYIGLQSIDIRVTASLTVEKTGGGADTICSKIAIDGVVQDKTIGCTENPTPTGIVSGGIFTVTNGQTVQVMVANLSTTADIDVATANLFVTGG